MTTATSPSVLDAARQYIDAAFLPVPVPHMQKKPVIDDWPSLRLTPENLGDYFNGRPQNIGIALGDDYGTTDVDLDVPEAVRAAPFFLPATGMKFGRRSKRASHWFYRSDPPQPTHQFQDIKTKGDPKDNDGEKMMILELRCQTTSGTIGLQTIVPPSTHRDTGELIEFEPGSGLLPANVDAPVLAAAVAKTAAAALLARHWPAPGGGRHDAMLSLAGLLARAGWSKDDAMVFCRAVYHSLCDPDRTQMHRSDSEVESSFKRSAERGTFTGWPTLAKSIGEDALKLACKWLDMQRGAAELVPSIRVTNRHQRDVVSETLAALAKANDPPELFCRGPHVVHVRPDRNGRSSIVTTQEAFMLGRMTRSANYFKLVNREPDREDIEA
jgi:hypothetical protein